MTGVTGVAIPRIDEETRKVREIPTPVCALARNDSFFFVQQCFRETAPGPLRSAVICRRGDMHGVSAAFWEVIIILTGKLTNKGKNPGMWV